MNHVRAVPVVLLLAACAARYEIVDAYRGDELPLSELADRLQDADVVIVGENHLSDEGHQAQLDLIAALHRRRPDLVVSMEMFERDVQIVLWEYLLGDLSEEEFLAESRPWPNYARHYRPIVEYAKAHRLPVIAANVPRPLAARVAREGLDSVRGELHAARQVLAPEDRYWQRFRQAMASHPGAFDDEAAIQRAYQAQCLKDATMAESIADYLRTARSELRRPLVVHLNGRFHSDHGLGVAARLQNRLPGAVVAAVSTLERSTLAESLLRSADPPAEFVFLVPDLPERPRARPETEAGEDAEAGEHEALPESEDDEAVQEVEEVEEEPQAASRPTSAPASPVDPEARPALGFRPDYEYGGEGVRIAALLPGGPAEKAGLHEGDVVIGVAGFHVADLPEYVEVLGMLRVGESVEAIVLRGGMIRRASLRVGRR